MKQVRLTLTVVLGVMVTALSAYAQKQYHPDGFVNDFAKILTSSQSVELDAILREYSKSTSIELVVVTVPSLDGQEIEEYATRLFNSWGIGKVGKDNGVLLLVAPNERSLRIEVGYGLEPDLTDTQANQIIEDYIVPFFKRGELYGGITAGLSEIISALGQSPFSMRAEERQREAEAVQRQEAKNAERNKNLFYGFTILVGAGLVIGVGVTSFLRWRRVKRLRVENLLRLNELEDKLGAINLTLPDSLTALENLKAISPSSVWNDYNKATNLSAHEIGRLALAEKAMYAKSGEVEDVANEVTRLEQQIESTNRMLTGIEAKTTEVKEAYAKWAKSVPTIPDKLTEAVKLISHPDVTNETRSDLERIKALFRAIGGYNPITAIDNTVDWIVTAKMVDEVLSGTSSIGKIVEKEKAFALEARAKHVFALTALLDVAQSVTQEFNHSDVSTTTKQGFAELTANAKQLSQSLVTDSVSRYRQTIVMQNHLEKLRDSAKKNKQDAEEARERARRRRAQEAAAAATARNRSSSSSSYGGRSSGGFGGGRSGGGGASGRW